MASCANATAGTDECKEDCKKECCTKNENVSEKEGCAKDCKKECCKHKEADELGQLNIGDENPSLSVEMKNITGDNVTLSGLAKENGLVVVFSCNTCPFVVGRANGESQGWENRYNDEKANAEANGLGFVLVNSNEAKRDGVDAFDKMVEHAKEANYDNMNYVVDENHLVADAFGARTTPHVYVFNKENKLVYKGAIDDNVDSKEEVKEKYLQTAIAQLVAGEEITPAETRNIGCSIKRVKK